jgi:hypothetical protein
VAWRPPFGGTIDDNPEMSNVGLTLPGENGIVGAAEIFRRQRADPLGKDWADGCKRQGPNHDFHETT